LPNANRYQAVARMKAADKKSQHLDAVVVGAGIIGLWTAVHLARRGCQVALIEQQTVPINATVNSGAGIRFFDPNTQIHDWVRQSHSFYQELGSSGAFTPAPAIYCLDANDDSTILMDAQARGFGLLDNTKLTTLYPDLTWPTSIWAVEDSEAGYRNPTQVCNALLSLCKQLGVHIAFGERVHALEAGQSLRVRTDQCAYCSEHVFLASGYWTPTLLKELGIPVQVRNRTVTIHYSNEKIHAKLPFLVEHKSGFHMRPTDGGMLFGLPQLDYDIPPGELPNRGDKQSNAAFEHIRRYLPQTTMQSSVLHTVRSADAFPLGVPSESLPDNLNVIALGQGSAFKYAPAMTLSHIKKYFR
jgi:glycine/D-amino acid oxidase-like deaminating enzyme